MNNTTTAKNPQSQGELAICETRTFERGGIASPSRYFLSAETRVNGIRFEEQLAGPFNSLAEANTALKGGR